MNVQPLTWLRAALAVLLIHYPDAWAAPCNTGSTTGLVREVGPIRYGPDAQANLLNMFTPTPAQLASLGLTKAAAMLVIHGRGGTYDQADFTTICETMALNGIACASIEYPIADGKSVFVWDQYGSVNCALRWLRANGARFNYGTAAIGVYGVSMGGLHTMWEVATQSMTTTPTLHQSVIEPNCPNAATPAGVDAAIIQYGQSDLSLPGPPYSNPQLLGSRANDAAWQAEFSPITYLNKVIPQMISVGNYDSTVNPANTGEWIKRLIALGASDVFADPTKRASCPVGNICGGLFNGRSQYWLLGGFGHGYELFNPYPTSPFNLKVPQSYNCAAVAFFWRALLPTSRSASTASSANASAPAPLQ